MTIKIDNDTRNLCVSGTNNTHQLSQCLNHDSVNSFETASRTGSGISPVFSTKAEARDFVTSILRGRGELLRKDEEDSFQSEYDSYADDDSSFASYGSSTISSETDLDKRRVQFEPGLITDIREIPRTPAEDIRVLFYSYEETQRFRWEYRLEKKLKLQLEDEANKVFEDSCFVPKEDPSISDYQKRSNAGVVTRVVVEHNDSSKTVYVEDNSYSKESGVMELFHDRSEAIVKSSSKGDDFFDNDSFWSGSITWY